MKNDHGVDAFYFHDKLGQVLRDLGSYKADELARALCRLAKVADENVLKEPEFAQHPAMAVPDGWKLVPFHATREQVNAVFMHPDLARTLHRNMVEAAPAAPVAQEPVVIKVMQFQLKHPDSGETHTVELTRGEVADGMEDTLYEKLSPMVCQCNGDADHECGDYIHDFDLVADPPAAEQPDPVAVPREVLRVLTDTAITEWHDPSEHEADQDRNECLCCGVEDGHNADCAVAIALRLLSGGKA